MENNQVENERSIFNNQERADMGRRLGAKIVQPTESINSVQEEIRSEPIIEEATDKHTYSGDFYDLGCTD
ncbi:hypothetical protein COU75_03410 [Candidatus Peregrinibacteria bacterium CG10_big_fil_rev_8_21_14_0_10_42_8]|nr:MAG: hypothetical protein COU75_03410 [Candidatus Peregrinibacteria bacterium CG10_big_fil_rev_8_21_14_0_10_42_8]